MDDPSAPRDRRAVTPAIVVSAAFVAACAVFAVAIVGARGGLEMPVAATQPPVAAASEEPIEPTPGLPTPGAATPAAPVTAAPTAAPTPAATPTATPAPTLDATAAPTPTPAPTYVVPTLRPGDPLLGLRACAGFPGCFEYTIVRGDTLSGVISRYLLDIDILEALNPGRLADPSLVVVGQLLYVGRDPLARLDACPDGGACVLYLVQPGDSVGVIAARYLLSREAILDANPGLPRPIEAGQVLKLPRLPIN